MSYSCSDILARCWWRNEYLPCCDIFTRQWSEYGACYSFNSASSASSPAVDRDHAWPWRVSSYNEWSGLRLEIKVHQSKYVNESRPLGTLFFVHDPFEWPNIARFIPAEATSAVRIWATTFYVSGDVHDLPLKQRQCILHDERKWKSGLALPYLRPNCISECRQVHTMKFCNCSIDILFPSGNGEEGRPI